ncbi:MAG: sensor histidine kinase [Rubrivivax sp.]
MKSVKWTLLALLLPSWVVLTCGQLWLRNQELRHAANAAYDRSLAGAIKGIDAGVSTASGGLAVELPYQMLEVFQLTANGKVSYRISTDDGLVTLGNADLPAPPQPLTPGVPQFYDADYFMEPVRIGAYLRPLDRPLYGTDAHNVMIQVAESTQSRSTFVAALLRQGALLDVGLMFTMAALMTAVVMYALRPLLILRSQVLRRADEDLAPIDPTDVPKEVRPLVEAINHHLLRWISLGRTQTQFLEDASHQLRTPLAVLRTQVDYALREPEMPRVQSALLAMRSGIDRSTRLVNQLLALARAGNPAGWAECTESINLVSLAHEVASSLLPQARRKRLDFSFIAPCADIRIAGIEVLLREAVSNLVDNAITHAPAGGRISVVVDSTGASARVSVADDGPGIPVSERLQVGERFRRGKAAPPGGAGLGLAIAKAIMEQHRGRLQVADAGPLPGLTIELVLPLVVVKAAAPAPTLRTRPVSEAARKTTS